MVHNSTPTLSITLSPLINQIGMLLVQGLTVCVCVRVVLLIHLSIFPHSVNLSSWSSSSSPLRL